jgi:hypothetical protein
MLATNRQLRGHAARASNRLEENQPDEVKHRVPERNHASNGRNLHLRYTQIELGPRPSKSRHEPSVAPPPGEAQKLYITFVIAITAEIADRWVLRNYFRDTIPGCDAEHGE